MPTVSSFIGVCSIFITVRRALNCSLDVTRRRAYPGSGLPPIVVKSIKRHIG